MRARFDGVLTLGCVSLILYCFFDLFELIFGCYRCSLLVFSDLSFYDFFVGLLGSEFSVSRY